MDILSEGHDAWEKNREYLILPRKGKGIPGFRGWVIVKPFKRGERIQIRDHIQNEVTRMKQHGIFSKLWWVFERQKVRQEADSPTSSTP